MQHRIIATTNTDPGKVRERNEDSAFANVAVGEETALLIVADGMGGYRAGDQASKIAVETIRDELEPLFVPSSAQPTVKLKQKIDENGEERSTVVLPETAASEHYGGFLTLAVRKANSNIVEYGRMHREARGMGSTVTVTIVARNRAYFANVGDSRSYLYRQGNLRAITRDHSLVARLVEAGEIEPDEIYAHPKRNLIYRSLGSDGERGVEVDLFEEELQPNDIIFLCSDGLWEKIRTPEMIEILRNTDDIASICQQFIELANRNGGEDNISVAMARYVGPTEPVVTSSSTSAQSTPTDIANVDTGELQTPNVSA